MTALHFTALHATACTELAIQCLSSFGYGLNMARGPSARQSIMLATDRVMHSLYMYCYWVHIVFGCTAHLRYLGSACDTSTVCSQNSIKYFKQRS